MVDRLPVVLRTDTTPARLQEMPAADLLPKSVLTNALGRQDHTGPLNWAWAIYGGTANAITLAPAFARTAYVVGDEFRFRATATNTGAATINVGGLGAKAAVTVTGAALPAGYIRTGVETVCIYDGTRFVVQREMERGSNANGTYVKFSDGTQICWGAVTMPNTAPSAQTIWSYPSSFITSPACMFATNSTIDGNGNAQGSGDLMRNGVYYSEGATGCTFLTYNYDNSRFLAVRLVVTAQGEWY